MTSPVNYVDPTGRLVLTTSILLTAAAFTAIAIAAIAMVEVTQEYTFTNNPPAFGDFEESFNDTTDKVVNWIECLFTKPTSQPKIDSKAEELAETKEKKTQHTYIDGEVAQILI